MQAERKQLSLSGRGGKGGFLKYSSLHSFSLCLSTSSSISLSPVSLLSSFPSTSLLSFQNCISFILSFLFSLYFRLNFSVSLLFAISIFLSPICLSLSACVLADWAASPRRGATSPPVSGCITVFAQWRKWVCRCWNWILKSAGGASFCGFVHHGQSQLTPPDSHIHLEGRLLLSGLSSGHHMTGAIVLILLQV